MSQSVTATWGKMLIAPIQFNNFEVGPFVMTVDVKPNEPPEEAFDRAYTECEKMARKSYAEKLKFFREAHAQGQAAIRGR